MWSRDGEIEQVLCWQCVVELWHSLPWDGVVSREKIMEKKSVEVY